MDCATEFMGFNDFHYASKIISCHARVSSLLIVGVITQKITVFVEQLEFLESSIPLPWCSEDDLRMACANAQCNLHRNGTDHANHFL